MSADTDVPDPQTSPLAFFGTELRRVRGAAKLTQGQTAQRTYSTQAMISYVESGKRVPTEELARELDRVFGTDGHFGRLHALVIRNAYPSWFLPYVELERNASSIRSFQNQLIHGLLQTEDYARAVLASARPDRLDELVAARMARQSLLEAEERPRAWFVIDEYALLRHIGGREAMRAQLERLLVAGEEPRTVIQVVPRTVAAHPGIDGPFTVFAFAEGADVLYVEGFGQGRTALSPDEVEEGIRTYDLLRSLALSHEASAELIAGHVEDLKS